MAEMSMKEKLTNSQNVGVVGQELFPRRLRYNVHYPMTQQVVHVHYLNKYTLRPSLTSQRLIRLTKFRCKHWLHVAKLLGVNATELRSKVVICVCDLRPAFFVLDFGFVLEMNKQAIISGQSEDYSAAIRCVN